MYLNPLGNCTTQAFNLGTLSIGLLAHSKQWRKLLQQTGDPYTFESEKTQKKYWKGGYKLEK